jgi:hypothetical protein
MRTDSVLDGGAAEVDVFDDRAGARLRTITRLRWRGWVVHVVDGAVVVPLQPTEGKAIGDLAVCLRSAYALVEVGDATSGPTTGARRIARGGPLAVAVAEVISAAAEAAGRSPHRGGCYVYDCLRRAWEDDGMRVPYAAVVAAVRACLPAGITLTDFSEGAAGVEPVYDLLNGAAVWVVDGRGLVGRGVTEAQTA